MTLETHTSLASAFVGRDREITALSSHLDAAGAGRGGLILLMGEAGADKTRTAEELSAIAASRGCRVVWGRCHEDEGAPPYWPWIELLRACLGDPSVVRELTDETTAHVSELLRAHQRIRASGGSTPKRDAAPPVGGSIPLM